MSFSFKPQQQLALEYPGNVAVSAGAGSGKTRVLVEKYFRLLVDEHPDWPIESVVAITFTIKAANELRQRIVKRVREELASGSALPERRARLLELRREVAGAPIGTIHNFCSRTLREFAFDARLNPDFAIVEGAQESSLRRDAVRQAVAEAMTDENRREYTDLLTLQVVYTQRQLYGMLETMLARRAEFGPPCHRYVSEPEEKIFAELEVLCGQAAGSSKEQLQNDLLRCLGALMEAVGTASEPLLRPLADRLSTTVEEHDRWTDFIELACEVQAVLFTKDGTLRKALEKSLGLANHQECVQRLLNACNASAEAAAMELGTDDRQSVTLAAMLARLYFRAEEVYGQSRSAANSADEVDLLDFTDLELLAERLIISNAAVRMKLRDRVRYLIVDEFQDTSELQWRILGPIVCADDTRMLPRRFFMVGDPKQGVYGFRQASSTLFAHVRDLVIDSNPADECRGHVSIAYNFRSLSTPLRAVNELFAQLMDVSQSVHEVAFEALEPQRLDPPGQTTLLLCHRAQRQRGDDTEEDPEDCGEAEVVAREIKELLAAEGPAGTIAILLRKRKHFETYERALRSRDIPYVTHRGKGLYEQPEVLDLVAVLRLLENPHEDRTVLEVCRGALFNFPDDLLLKIALGRGRTFWDKCCRAAGSGYNNTNSEQLALQQEDLCRLNQLTTIIHQLTQMVGFSDLGDLLTAIVQLTGARVIFGASARGSQSLANVQRFVELSRAMQSTDVAEFLAYVESESFDTGGQGEATVHTTRKHTVQIMTIHAAKGLEFDTVFLPELAEPIKARSEEVLTDGHEWLALQKTLSAEKPKLFLTSHLARQKKERAFSEEKRVLYVAMTRCKDNLFLSATAGGTQEQDSFYGWMLPHLSNLSITRRTASSPSKHESDSADNREEKPAASIALHDGRFEQKRNTIRQRLEIDLDWERPAEPQHLKRIPFSPPAAPAAEIAIALDVLLATAIAPAVAREYLLFRHAFAAGAAQLHRGSGNAAHVSITALNKTTFQQSERTSISTQLALAWDLLGKLEPDRQFRSGTSTTVALHGFLISMRPDLELSGHDGSQLLVVAPNAESRTIVERLAVYQTAILATAGILVHMQIADLVSGRIIDSTDANPEQKALRQQIDALYTQMQQNCGSLSTKLPLLSA
ncbi:MAG: UvrD-helicase domain-containing protein [Candidatus Sumerlaeaceae bacterium]